MKVEVAVLGSPSLVCVMVSVDVKQQSVNQSIISNNAGTYDDSPYKALSVF